MPSVYHVLISNAFSVDGPTRMISHPPPKLVRYLDRPLLHIGSHPSIGRNINGPCVIRTPDWVPDALGRFYMYFAHHTGTHIRLAIADNVRGPWRVADTPPLRLSDSKFAQNPVTYRTAAGRLVTEPAHIASPDVHILEKSRQIVMLFHGLQNDGTQSTGVAVSTNGRDFSTEGFETNIAPPYLRVCKTPDQLIGVAWGGEVFTSHSLLGPFEKGPPVLERPNGPDLIPRHPALVWKNGTLHCFYTLIGDCPERVWHVPVSPGASWSDWQTGTPNMILAPDRIWEGSDIPETPSRIGEAKSMEKALRDPFVFEDHVFYAGGGENCIAAQRIEWH